MEHISATIITRNEESQIERCLSSLQGVVDEIIVVDSFSTDLTPEICRRYGCKVTQRAFTGFGSQRQYAVGLTSHSYVLAIDADEVLSDQLREELISMKQEGFKHRVYSIDVINYFCGIAVRHSGWRPKRDIRLFNKRYANWNINELGERVTFDPLLIPCPVKKGHIDHFRVNSDEEFTRKELRRSSLLGRILATSNKSISPVTPIVRAAADFASCMITQGAILDGSNGNKIAFRRYTTTYNAYSIARKLLLKRRNKH